MKLTQNLGMVIMALGSFFKMKANLKHLCMVMDKEECKRKTQETGSRNSVEQISWYRGDSYKTDREPGAEGLWENAALGISPYERKEGRKTSEERGSSGRVGGGDHGAARVKLWLSSLGNPEDGRALQVYFRLE